MIKHNDTAGKVTIRPGHFGPMDAFRVLADTPIPILARPRFIRTLWSLRTVTERPSLWSLLVFAVKGRHGPIPVDPAAGQGD